MNMKNTLKIALLGLVLVAAFVLPASAVQEKGNGMAAGKAVKIDDGLKNDLWDVYGEYRLRIFDTRVEGAGEAVAVLGNHGCPTTDLEATVTSIGGEREALSTALENHDRAALKTVNQELLKLWKQYREQFRASLKACSGQPGDSPETPGLADL